jgi:hypothetical protein
MNPDKNLFDLLVELIEKVLGHPVSPLFEKALAAFFIFAIILIAINAFVLGIKTLIKEVVIPIFYDKEQKRRRYRRQLFADHIESEIRYLNSRESWNDNRFAELEAEVDAEGSRKIFGWIKINFGSGTRLRREKSLSMAISRTAVPLVLLEGDPGSGKSVALRHVAQKIARRATKSRSLQSVIPLYINLKNLKREEGKVVDRNFIGDFVLKSINRINDRDIDEFLKDEFQDGLEEGSWFFLFDSFDEIPEILSSTEADNTIRLYAEAIRDFLYGMNKCRGIVASREYKGPRYLGWPKFRIVPLTENRREELIKRTNLPSTIQENIHAGISFASVEFRAMTSNPMFLSLLCEYMQRPDAEFPQYTHIVYEEYISKRLSRDEDRLKMRFGKLPSELRNAAEKIAFCMTADVGLGLSPTIESLKLSTEKLNLSLGQNFDIYIEALEYLKLARIDKQLDENVKLFTFSHRRFQEYFATAIVLREPSRVTAKELLMNAQWRETAVTLLQTQDLSKLTDIILTAEKIFGDSLELMSEDFENYAIVPEVLEKPKTFFERLDSGLLAKHLFENKKEVTKWIESIVNEYVEFEKQKKAGLEKKKSYNEPIIWPIGVYHLLSILQDGVSGKDTFFHPALQKMIEKFLCYVMDKGSLDDKKMIVEISGVASTDILVHILKTGFNSPGNWTKMSAYRQLGRLRKIASEFAKFIRAMLTGMMFNGKLFFARREIYAQLSRLDKSKSLINTARLLAWIPVIDHLFVILSIVIVLNIRVLSQSTLISIVFFMLLSLFLRWYSKPIWELGAFMSPTEYYYRWITTPQAFATASIFIILIIWFFLQTGISAAQGRSAILNPSFSVSADLAIFYSLLFTFILSLNIWSSVATAEGMVGKRTSPIWWLAFLLYPFIIIPGFLLIFILEVIWVLLLVGDTLFVLIKIPSLSQAIRAYPDISVFKFVRYFLSKFSSLAMGLIAIISLTLLYIVTKAFGDEIFVYSYIACLIILIAFLVVAFLFTLFSNYIKKNIELRYFEENQPSSSIHLLEFLAFLQKFKNRTLRLMILRDIINRQLIVLDEESESHLRNLIAFVHAILEKNIINHYRYLKEQDLRLAEVLDIDKIEKAPKSLVWDGNQLDELCLLLEQKRSIIGG